MDLTGFVLVLDSVGKSLACIGDVSYLLSIIRVCRIHPGLCDPGGELYFIRFGYNI